MNNISASAVTDTSPDPQQVRLPFEPQVANQVELHIARLAVQGLLRFCDTLADQFSPMVHCDDPEARAWRELQENSKFRGQFEDLRNELAATVEESVEIANELAPLVAAIEPDFTAISELVGSRLTFCLARIDGILENLHGLNSNVFAERDSWPEYVSQRDDIDRPYHVLKNALQAFQYGATTIDGADLNYELLMCREVCDARFITNDQLPILRTPISPNAFRILTTKILQDFVTARSTHLEANLKAAAKGGYVQEAIAEEQFLQGTPVGNLLEYNSSELSPPMIHVEECNAGEVTVSFRFYVPEQLVRGFVPVWKQGGKTEETLAALANEMNATVSTIVHNEEAEPEADHDDSGFADDDFAGINPMDRFEDDVDEDRPLPEERTGLEVRVRFFASPAQNIEGTPIDRIRQIDNVVSPMLYEYRGDARVLLEGDGDGFYDLRLPIALLESDDACRAFVEHSRKCSTLLESLPRFNRVDFLEASSDSRLTNLRRRLFRRRGIRDQGVINAAEDGRIDSVTFSVGESVTEVQDPTPLITRLNSVFHWDASQTSTRYSHRGRDPLNRVPSFPSFVNIDEGILYDGYLPGRLAALSEQAEIISLPLVRSFATAWMPDEVNFHFGHFLTGLTEIATATREVHGDGIQIHVDNYRTDPEAFANTEFRRYNVCVATIFNSEGVRVAKGYLLPELGQERFAFRAVDEELADATIQRVIELYRTAPSRNGDVDYQQFVSALNEGAENEPPIHLAPELHAHILVHLSAPGNEPQEVIEDSIRTFLDAPNAFVTRVEDPDCIEICRLPLEEFRETSLPKQIEEPE